MRNRFAAVLWAAFAVLLLGGLYFGLQYSLRADDASGPQPPVYRLSVSAPHLGEELPVFKALQGDTVMLMIRSDRPGEVDVHGYEKKIDLQAGGEVALTFTAEHAGVFPIHLHESVNPNEPDGPVTHRHLATIEVQAR